MPAPTSRHEGADELRSKAPSNFHELRLIMVITQCTFAVFMGRQAWLQQSAVSANRPNVERLLAELGRMEQIRNEFARFAATHPNFTPILNKYGIQASGQATPSVPRN